MKIDFSSSRRPDDWHNKPKVRCFIADHEFLPSWAYVEIMNGLADVVEDALGPWSDFIGNGRLLVEHLS